MTRTLTPVSVLVLTFAASCATSGGVVDDAGTRDAGEVGDGDGDGDGGENDAGPDEAPDGGSSPDAGGIGGDGDGDGDGDCSSIVRAANVNESGYIGEHFTWHDDGCRGRSALLVYNTAGDPAGRNGGYMRRLTYEGPEGTRTNTGSHPTHPGMGIIVSHFNGGATVSSNTMGAWRVVTDGPHHQVFEYTWSLFIGSGNVDVTAWWTFTTGRSHPLFAVTYDASPAGANVVNGDSRSPYGDLAWDANQGLDVDGVGWGDRYKFRTTSPGPVTMSSAWTYEEPNRVPHVVQWSNAFDAEMGLVQTEEQTRKHAGGYWFYGSWGSSSSGPMPEDWNWTYQLNQYELPFTTKSHRMSWGLNYGAVGQQSYNVYGDDGTASGYPYQSYAVFIALGTRGTVDDLVTHVEAMADATLTCSSGAPRASVEGGAGRTDLVSTTNGFHPVFASFDVVADAGAAACTLDLPASGATAPLVRVHGLTSAPDVDAPGETVVSFDDETGIAWITFLGSRTGALTFSL
jgi:hypothetical protein